MRVLLDNCVARRFGQLISEHDVKHAQELGWDTLDDRELVAKAESEGFDVLVTIDQGIQHQVSFEGRKIGLITLKPGRFVMAGLSGLAPKLHEALKTPRPGESVLLTMD